MTEISNTEVAMSPRDAATLVIIRDGREVLMGLRHHNHVFMPNKYVFPGGRMDDVDSAAHRPVSLDPRVSAKLQIRSNPELAEPLAMAAVRETFEETGLVLGMAHSISEQQRQAAGASWMSFFETGMVPALHRLEFIARAITPPGRSRRFDARFFMTDARYMSGTLKGNGELLDLQWFSIEDSLKLDLPPITRYVLELLQPRLGSAYQVPPGATESPVRPASATSRADANEDMPIPFIRWHNDDVVVDEI